MNRIDTLFTSGIKDILSIYFTAGYPSVNDTIRIIKELEKNNVDMIEIGIPFSDPIADGPVIQASSERALYNGMNVRLLFTQLENIREITDKPLILMGYLNPVLRFGMDAFLLKCRQTGIDGLILPDLPAEEYTELYRAQFEKFGIKNILFISPQTPDERILYLDSVAEGFIYMVSTAATTGVIDLFSNDQLNYFKRVDRLDLKTPRLIGFGVSNHDTFLQACKYSNGAIVGSAFIRAIESTGAHHDSIKQIIGKIRGETS